MSVTLRGIQKTSFGLLLTMVTIAKAVNWMSYFIQHDLWFSDPLDFCYCWKTSIQL